MELIPPRGRCRQYSARSWILGMTRMTLCVHHQPTVKLKTQNVKRATFLATNSSYSSSSHFSLLFRAANLDWIKKKYKRRISATGQSVWSHSILSAKVNTLQVFTHVTRFFGIQRNASSYSFFSEDLLPLLGNHLNTPTLANPNYLDSINISCCDPTTQKHRSKPGYSSVLNRGHVATIWNFDPNYSLPKKL